MTSKRIRLTARAIADSSCPPGKRVVNLWDRDCPGLAVRVYKTGTRTWAIYYRPRRGRGTNSRWFTLGSAAQLGPVAARDAARKFFTDRALGHDPGAERAAQRAEAKAAAAAALGLAIDAYGEELERRGIVKRAEVLSALRRGLCERLGREVDVRTIMLRHVAERIRAIAGERPGAASYFRKAATGFFSWLASEGVIPVSPLAGYRKPRRSRAERLERAGRALEDHEIAALWRGTATPFGFFIRLCLLTGARRGEVAALRWHDLDLGAGTWAIPAAITKTGRARTAYLAPLAVDVLRAVVRLEGELVFSSARGTPITGWTKRVAAVAKVSGVDFTLHDLRRIFRTGLSRLQIDRDTAEICLGHWRGDLLEAYDRDNAEQRQRAAVGQWSRCVAALAAGDTSDVVPLRIRA